MDEIINNEPTVESYEQEKATLEHIENLSEAELEAELQNNAKEEVPADAPTRDEAPTDHSNQEEQPTESHEDELKAVLIDEEYIKNAPDEDKVYLESIKGETLSPKMLNKHLSAEKLADKIKGEKGDIVSKLKELERTHEESRAKLANDVTKLPEGKEDKVKELVSERMKAKFNDYPTTEEEREDLRYNDLDRYLEIREAEKQEKLFVQQHVEKTEFVQQHYGEINSNILNNDIDLIRKEMDKLGITEEDLGVTLGFDENGNFKDSRLDELLLDGGKYDNSIIDTRYGVPLVKENSFASKFEKAFREKIYTAIREKGMLDGSKGTVDQSKLRGMSNQKPGSQQPFKNLEEKIDSMSLEEIEKELQT